MKQKLLLKTMLLLCALIAGSSSVWAAVTWERVTSVQTLLDGGTFIMGYEATANSGVIVPLRTDATGATTSANGILYSGTGTGTTSNNETINMSSVSETDKYELYITASTVTNAINMQLGSSTGDYIGCPNSKNTAKLYTSASENTAYTLTIGSNDVFTLECKAADTGSKYKYLKFNNNSGSYRYANYSSEPEKIVFYKKITGKKTKPIIKVFEETFDKNSSQGGNDDKWDQGSGSVTLDNATGISLSSSAYGANKCVRLGTSSAQGSATISITGNVDDVFTLSFKAAPWNTESSTKATVTVTGGTITGISTSNMSTKQWNEYEGTITATDEDITIVIASSGSKRFFLDEVLITQDVPNPTVTLAASGYASYCNEYPLDFTTTSGYKAYYVSGVTGSTVTFSQITGKIMGGQGIILFGTPNAVCDLTYCDSDNELSENMLVGTLVPTAITTVNGDYTNFGLSGGSFKKINNGTLPANKAYLPVLTANLPSSATEFSIVFDDVTGISRVENIQIANESYYDLQGRKVENPTKGLYIVNGKKVVIK